MVRWAEGVVMLVCVRTLMLECVCVVCVCVCVYVLVRVRVCVCFCVCGIRWGRSRTWSCSRGSRKPFECRVECELVSVICVRK